MLIGAVEVLHYQHHQEADIHLMDGIQHHQEEQK